MHILFTIGRVLLVLIFIVSGAQKLIDIPGTANQIQSVLTIPGELQEYVGQVESVTSMRWPQILAIIVGVVEVVGGLLIAFNIATRIAAAILVLFTIVATYNFHAFWTMSGEAMQNNMIHFEKNLAIIGGLLIMFVLGPWRPARPNQM
jgi:putative oxidoreductase